MSIREVTMYRVVCDWPGCDVSAEDGTDYYAWTEPGLAVDTAAYAGWWEGRDDKIYCLAHPQVLAGDHEAGAPLPAPPYLLVDDEGDGCVSYVEVAS